MSFGVRLFYYGDIPEDKAGGNINTPLGDGGTKIRLAAMGSFHPKQTRPRS